MCWCRRPSRAVAIAMVVPFLFPRAAPTLELLPPEEAGGGCYATSWTTNRAQVEELVSSLRERGYIAGAEYGVHEAQVGYRVMAPGRARVGKAQRLIRVARNEGFQAVVAQGADGRSSVSYGFFERRARAQKHAAALQEAEIDAEVEPAYHTRSKGRVVVQAPIARVSVVSFGEFWQSVDCGALRW